MIVSKHPEYQSAMIVPKTFAKWDHREVCQYKKTVAKLTQKKDKDIPQDQVDTLIRNVLAFKYRAMQSVGKAV